MTRNTPGTIRSLIARRESQAGVLKKKNKSGVDCTIHSMQSCDAEIIISEYYN